MNKLALIGSLEALNLRLYFNSIVIGVITSPA